MVVGGSQKEFKAFARKQMGNLRFSAGKCSGYAIVVPGQPWMIWNADLKSVIILAHEALHVASRILRNRGIVLCDESEEAFTYLQGDIMRQVLTADKKKWHTVK